MFSENFNFSESQINYLLSLFRPVQYLIWEPYSCEYFLYKRVSISKCVCKRLLPQNQFMKYFKIFNTLKNWRETPKDISFSNYLIFDMYYSTIIVCAHAQNKKRLSLRCNEQNRNEDDLKKYTKLFTRWKRWTHNLKHYVILWINKKEIMNFNVLNNKYSKYPPNTCLSP